MFRFKNRSTTSPKRRRITSLFVEKRSCGPYGIEHHFKVMPITIAAIIAFSLLVVVLTVWFSGLGVLAMGESFIRAGIAFWGPLLVAVILLAWGFNHSGTNKLRRGLALSLAIVITLTGVGNLIIGHNYLSHKLYTSDVVTVEETTNFAERAPWTVAESYAARDQGDIIGDRESIHYVPTAKDAEATDGEGTSRYTTLVRGRSVLGLTGYQAIQTLQMPTTGPIPSSASSYCELPEDMNDRLGAFWPGHSLSWSIHAQKPLAHWDSDDAYGYCNGDEPVIVVPLWKYEGFWLTKRAADGAAVYTADGVEILSADELVEEGIEGPTYPRSLAEIQRKAINAGGSLGDWWGSRFGYDSTEKDDEDANEGNTTEFTLMDDEGVMSYVTPMTPKGSSQSITAVSVIPAQQGYDPAKIVVNTSTDLGSTSTVTTAIKESSVSGDNAWTTRWASGMSVYEILPGADGHWVASIGQGQAVSYRADIAPDGSVTVTNSETGQSSTGKDDEKKDSDSVTVEGDKPLSEMSEAELLERIEQATTELQEREKAAK